MTVPRFPIRSLMIAVAVAAVWCWLLATRPMVGLLLWGPVVGVAFAFRLSRDPAVARVSGSVACGAVGCFACAMLLEALIVPGCLGIAHQWGWGLYARWFVISGLAGFLVGLTALSVDVFESSHGPGERPDASAPRV